MEREVVHQAKITTENFFVIAIYRREKIRRKDVQRLADRVFKEWYGIHEEKHRKNFVHPWPCPLCFCDLQVHIRMASKRGLHIGQRGYSHARPRPKHTLSLQES
jgi:hypothetical protein